MIGAALPAALGHREAMTLAATEFDMIGAQLTALAPADWARPTVCGLWDVRQMAAHVLGMAEAQASFRQFSHDFRAAGKRTSGKMIDEMSATQVRERAAMTPASIITRLEVVAPKAVRTRRRTPALARRAVRIKNDPPFESERWPYGYLVDIIFTRDTWMHRLDISRATSRPMNSPLHTTAASWRRGQRLGAAPRQALLPEVDRPCRGTVALWRSRGSPRA